MNEYLIMGALNEIAEALGDSNSNPISTSLLCLRLGLTFDQKGKIMVAFNQVLHENNFDDLTVELFRKALVDVVPMAKDFADVVVMSLIKAYARNHIAELVPFARTLE